jgi:low affinity Fe/Cu permease
VSQMRAYASHSAPQVKSVAMKAKRGPSAIHAKLDELLRAQGDAKTGLTTWDNKEPEQIEAFRKKVRTK